MKKIIFTLLTIFSLTTTIQAEAQTDITCEQTGWSVNIGSIADFVKMYHAGHYLIWPREENVITWTATDNQGNLIVQETIIDSSDFSFNHSVPTTDIIHISAELNNQAAGISGCYIEDVLFWEQTEVTPGVFSYSWALLNGNTPTTLGGQDKQLLDVTITSTLIDAYIELRSANSYTISIYDKRGRSVKKKRITTQTNRMPVGDLPPGMYFVKIVNDQNASKTIKIIKK